MPRTTTRRARLLLVLLPTMGLTAGGWSVTTIDALPDYLVAGRATTLGFVVRGHGEAPIEGLRPRVEARSGAALVTAIVPAGPRDGHYAAPIELPRAGEWSITLHSGLGRERVDLDPIAVVAPGARAPAPFPDAERGRRLFTAKGCVTCHVRLDVGPRLTGRRYDPAWLARFLEHPQQVRPAPAGRPQMPRLGLDAREIAALVAYVNTGTVASR
ncbi:MAG TPA: c-type cytochrome [Gemmatimonadaceae bacterium]|nr:c-type cytochrome [Gemmatimonadaceae bacterium]